MVRVISAPKPVNREPSRSRPPRTDSRKPLFASGAGDELTRNPKSEFPKTERRPNSELRTHPCSAGKMAKRGQTMVLTQLGSSRQSCRHVAQVESGISGGDLSRHEPWERPAEYFPL